MSKPLSKRMPNNLCRYSTLKEVELNSPFLHHTMMWIKLHSSPLNACNFLVRADHLLQMSCVDFLPHSTVWKRAKNSVILQRTNLTNYLNQVTKININTDKSC